MQPSSAADAQKAWSVELQEAVGILLHEDPTRTVTDVQARLAAGWPSVHAHRADQLPEMQPLVEELRPTYVALQHWEQLEPDAKELAYAAVSGWLVNQATGLALQSARATKEGSATANGNRSSWSGTLVGIGSGLLLGGGLVAGGWAVGPMVLGALAVGGGAVGRASAKVPPAKPSLTGLNSGLREHGRGVSEPIVRLLVLIPELQRVSPDKWPTALEAHLDQVTSSDFVLTHKTKAAAARCFLEDCYRFQLSCRFGPIVAAASRGGLANTSDPGGSAMICTCISAVACADMGGGTEGKKAAATVGLRLLCSEWEFEDENRRSMWRLYKTEPEFELAQLASEDSDGSVRGLEPTSTLIVAFCSDATGRRPHDQTALSLLDTNALTPVSKDSLPAGTLVHAGLHKRMESTLQRLVPAIIPYCGKGLGLRLVGHAFSGGVAQLALVEILTAPALSLGGQCGQLREGFSSIRCVAAGSPSVVAVPECNETISQGHSTSPMPTFCPVTATGQDTPAVMHASSSSDSMLWPQDTTAVARRSFAAAEIDFDVDFSRLSASFIPPMQEPEITNDRGAAADSGWRQRLFCPVPNSKSLLPDLAKYGNEGCRLDVDSQQELALPSKLLDAVNGRIDLVVLQYDLLPRLFAVSSGHLAGTGDSEKLQAAVEGFMCIHDHGYAQGGESLTPEWTKAATAAAKTAATTLLHRYRPIGALHFLLPRYILPTSTLGAALAAMNRQSLKNEYLLATPECDDQADLLRLPPPLFLDCAIADGVLHSYANAAQSITAHLNGLASGACKVTCVSDTDEV